MKKCPSCKQLKPLIDFNKSKDRKDGHQVYCKICSRSQNQSHYNRNKSDYYARVVKARERNKQYIRSEKNKPCADCGIKYPWYVMDFDHLDATTKISEVSIMVNQAASIEKIQQEIDKCDLVCANCHRIRTFKRVPWGVEELADSFGFDPKVL